MKAEMNTGTENSGMQVCSLSRILSKLQNNLLEKKNDENYQSGQLEVGSRDLETCTKDHSPFRGTETRTNNFVNKQYNKLPSN